MNKITITLGSDASADDIARAVSAMQAFTGQAVEFVTGTLETTITGQQVAAEQAGDIELDSEGLPHDERIHAGTKGKTQAGAWTKKKGVDDKVRDAVVAELRQKFPAPVAASAPVAAPATVTVPGISVPSIAPKTEYQNLCDFIATHVGKGPLTQQIVDETFKGNNTNLPALAGSEEHSAAFLKAFTDFVATNS